MSEQLDVLYNNLYKYLLTLIRKRLYKGCPDDLVYDCLNDVFEIALRKQYDPKFQRDPEGWLIITAKNVVDNFNRKSVRRLNFYQSDCDISRITHSQDIFEELIYRISVEDHIMDKMKASLSESDLILFDLRFEQNLSSHEIADQLGISAGTINTRISRLKQRVRNYIHKKVG